MTNPALYDIDAASRDLHGVVIALVESLDDAQLTWRPDDFATSIGFHAWHLARESDYLRSKIVELVPQLGPEFGPPTEIWERERLAARWGFGPELATTVGTGLTDELAMAMPIPPKAELLGYLRRSYADLEAFVERLDGRFGPAAAADEDPELAARVGRLRVNVVGFLTHDGRHLGMMEVLKGLQTGFGSASETRPAQAPTGAGRQA